MSPVRARFSLVVLGALLQLWALSALVWSPGEDLVRHVVLFLGAWLVYVVAIGVALGLPSNAVRGDLALIFAMSLLVRGTLLLSGPSLSDDVFRSVWDARVMHAGVNPYQYAPAAPELEPYRDDAIWPRVNHKEQRTPYPPIVEILGAAAYLALPERLVAFQGLAAGLDLLSAGLLAWLLARVGLDPRRSLVIAWSPAGALHFAHSGHNDAAMVAALVGAALLLSYDRRWATMAAVAVATMAKAVPALALPAFCRATGWSGALVWALVVTLIISPFASAGAAALTGLAEEGSVAQFNDSLHFVFHRVTAAFVGGTPIPALVSLGLVLAAAGIIGRYADPSPVGVLQAGGRVLGAYLLVAPAVQPWYAPWMAPLVAVSLGRGGRWFPLGGAEGLAWLWLTGAIVLTELTYAPGMSGLWPVIRLVEYGPLYGLLAVALLGWRRGGIPTLPRRVSGRPKTGQPPGS